MNRREFPAFLPESYLLLERDQRKFAIRWGKFPTNIVQIVQIRNVDGNNVARWW